MNSSEDKRFNLVFAMLLPTLATAMLVVLKLAGYVDWSWWLILAPVWLIWAGLLLILLSLMVRTKLYKSGVRVKPTLLAGKKRQSSSADSSHIFKS